MYWKYVWKIKVSLKSKKNKWGPHMNTDIRFRAYLAQFFLEWEMFQTKVVEKIITDILYSINFFFENRAVYEIMWENTVKKIKTHILYSINSFRKSCRLWDNVGKYCRAGQATYISLPKTQTLPRWSAFFFESRDDCSCRAVFCRSYEEPLQGRDNGAGASLE